MKIRNYLVLYFVAIGLFLVLTIFQTGPGYMDAEYYFAGGQQLATNKGFWEPYYWNFLDGSTGFPHAAFTYWMPLTSILAASGMALAGSTAFFWARFPFVLLAGLIPVLTAHLAAKLGGKPWQIWMAGILAVFSGFYWLYITLTETFILYILLGGCFILLTISSLKREKFAWLKVFALGAVSGMMHMARADGLLWLGAAALILILDGLITRHENSRGINRVVKWVSAELVLGSGYLVVALPWLWRNWTMFGIPMAPGGSRAIWITSYNQTFAFPPNVLTFRHWVAAGVSNYFSGMLNALKFNLINALAVQAAIFLLPLMVVGVVVLWKNRGVKIAFWMWMGTLAIMTFVFPYSGARGGFIHSGAAVQTVLWAVCPFGLDALLQLGIRKRGWSSRNARIAFSVGVLFFAVVYSVAIFWIRVPGGKLDAPVWTQPSRNYAKVEAFLTSAGIPPREGVIVGDPPGYYLISGRNAVVTPDLGQPNTINDFATKFHTCILILEADHLESMDDWYRDSGTAGFHYIGNVDTIQVFDVCKAK